MRAGALASMAITAVLAPRVPAGQTDLKPPAEVGTEGHSVSSVG